MQLIAQEILTTANMKNTQTEQKRREKNEETESRKKKSYNSVELLKG